MVTTLDMGRTFKLPILKPGVSCIAAISKENVSCTDVCIVAAGCGLVTGAAGGLLTGVAGGLLTGAAGGLVIGAGGIWVGSGMVAGVVVCGNSGSAEVAAWMPGAVAGSATGDCAKVTASWCGSGYFCSIGSVSGSVGVDVSTARGTSPSAAPGISIGSSAAIAEDPLTILAAEASAWMLGCEVSAVCSMIGPTPDSRSGSANDGTSGSLFCDVSPGYSITGPTDSDSK